ncbi:tetratricopeptide repeat protein [Pseudoduganella violaceinigra]|uniref:tetratricopeptide repeat protein n=1 Tax=Pseudoduganella violaceinigra TaxID=246602 RepID=UPI0009FCA481|nr:tetratricopeptide repeat protein [Pseudoduganella violaceinigra]
MKYRLLALAAILCAAAGSASARHVCGELTGREYDYRTGPEYMLNLVNDRHFTEDVEQGIRGASGALAPDIEYTLRVFPNHKRALATALRMAARYPSGVMPEAKLPIECYFERAVRVFPDDSVTWLMYARFQYMKGHEAQATTMLTKALELSPDDPTINYNLGLAYAKQKKYEQALPYAQKAYSLQFPLPGLKQMLVKAGKWVEPPPPPPADEKAEAPVAAAAAASAASAPPAEQAAATPVASTPPVKP